MKTNSKSKKQATISLFDEDDQRPAGWTDEHIALLREHWARMKPTVKMFEYNRDWYRKVHTNMISAELRFIAAQNIPHLSKWAQEAI